MPTHTMTTPDPKHPQSAEQQGEALRKLALDVKELYRLAHHRYNESLPALQRVLETISALAAPSPSPATSAEQVQADEDRLFTLRERIKDLARDYGDERSSRALNGWPRNREPSEVMAELETAVDALGTPTKAAPQEPPAAAFEALFTIANEIHGTLDRQTYDEHRRAEWELLDEHEFSVTITAGQERALSRAILAVEQNRAAPAAAAPVQDKAGEVAADMNSLRAALAAQPVAQEEATPVYVVATGETHEGRETYTLHDERVPMCDQEVLFRSRRYEQTELDAASARARELAAGLAPQAAQEDPQPTNERKAP